MNSFAWVSPICRICIICRIWVIYLTEWNTCDLHDIYTGMGYVRSAWYAHFVGGLSDLQDLNDRRIFAWSGGSVKSGCFTLVCNMFSRHGSVWGGYFTGVYLSEICMKRRIFHRCVLEWDLYDLQDMYDLSICMICKNIYMIYLSGVCAIWMMCTS